MNKLGKNEEVALKIDPPTGEDSATSEDAATDLSQVALW